MVLPRFVRQALAGDELTVYGDGSQSRCFTHVYDTVDALLSLIETDAAIGNVYNIGSAQPVTIIELARRVIERTGSSSQLQLIPYEQAYSDGFEELGRRRPDCTALESLTGWRPQRTLDDAIDDAIACEQGAFEQSREGRLGLARAGKFFRGRADRGRELSRALGLSA